MKMLGRAEYVGADAIEDALEHQPRRERHAFLPPSIELCPINNHSKLSVFALSVFGLK